ncbi:hypothetical protein DL765_006820 [Monosporascus sp. GIB2]|nr:hypothetical protein DL765_006820 [Monosporascus sp. GIB2]
MEYNTQQQQTLASSSLRERGFDYGGSFRVSSDETKALADDISYTTMLRGTFQQLRKNEVVTKPFAANTVKRSRAAGASTGSQVRVTMKFLSLPQ